MGQKGSGGGKSDSESSLKAELVRFTDRSDVRRKHNEVRAGSVVFADEDVLIMNSLDPHTHGRLAQITILQMKELRSREVQHPT